MPQYLPKQEKDHHDWQQSIDEAQRFVEIFSEASDLVFDPFGGSFTNAIACYEHGRRFVGYDIEEQDVRLGQHRLADAIENAKGMNAVADKIALPTTTPNPKSA